ncbi:hypothetical protein DRF65_27645 [Chryseobacterium pennae]|uniref:Uncharacterized protein n=1 Tax=Chryseobacterium pennae TaxID=2258962 RepID=A0A3D9C0P5_9FLAO|nr:hypothetical protein [Chryseobacterium pennae]REC59116.1 hypothetical protein DRF65_27645 [Chryseobacterium pennae]
MKKIYYAPGLISAILIPLLFWYYGNQRVHPQYTAIDLGIPGKIMPKIPIQYTFEFVRNWNYKKITVSPNTALQNQEYYISELKKIQTKNEKETGIEFIINDENSYQDFITLINVMLISKQESYTVDMEKTGHVFAIHSYKDPNKIEKDHYFPCGTQAATIHYKEETQYKGFDRLKSFAELPKQSFYIIFGFMLFLNISMLSIKENLQFHKKE